MKKSKQRKGEDVWENDEVWVDGSADAEGYIDLFPFTFRSPTVLLQ